ncbi:S24 family peptidase [Neisseria sp. S1]|uniref:S24 family peptidase n=1 Tax=Neisseria sp. S1 TaxID=3318354 RepID=UPI003A89CD53
MIHMSAADLLKVVNAASQKGIEIDLPRTAAGIAYRARSESWPYTLVDTQGGKDGKKRLYTLPRHVIEKFSEKGVLYLLDSNEPQVLKETSPEYSQNSFDLSKTYISWLSKQDSSDIVPVRYYKEVFASAGNGAIPWDTEPEAMWFRDSFFKYLGVSPADCFCTRIDGDSMFPTLIDQGTALWHATKQYSREGIYLFRQHSELRVKRLQRVNAYIFNIISDNSNKSIYPTVELDLSKIDSYDFEILGRYLWSCGIAK